MSLQPISLGEDTPLSIHQMLDTADGGAEEGENAGGETGEKGKAASSISRLLSSLTAGEGGFRLNLTAFKLDEAANSTLR